MKRSFQHGILYYMYWLKAIHTMIMCLFAFCLFCFICISKYGILFGNLYIYGILYDNLCMLFYLLSTFPFTREIYFIILCFWTYSSLRIGWEMCTSLWRGSSGDKGPGGRLLVSWFGVNRSLSRKDQGKRYDAAPFMWWLTWLATIFTEFI